MSLKAERLTFAYEPGQRAVSEVSLELKPGELLGVIGPNGSGKSTLLRLLAGILPAQEGSIMLDGQPLAASRMVEKATRIAFLPQLLQPAFAFTCEEVVAQGRYPHLGALGFLSRKDLALVRACLQWTNAAEFAQRPLDDLSGGERQRVLLASVLAQQADYLLLDEPTAALDIHHQAEVFSLLQRLAKNGFNETSQQPAAENKNGPLSVAVVVHDLNLAGQYCDRLALMSVGSIAAIGPPTEVLVQERLLPIYGGNITVAKHPLTGNPLVSVLANTMYSEKAE